MGRFSPTTGDAVRAATHADVVPFIGNDAALVEGLRTRQPSAVATLIDRYGALVQRVLARVVGTDPEFDDLLHDVFASAIAGVHRLRDATALADWLTSVTIFRARTYIKRRARHRWLKLFAPDDLPEAVAITTSDEVATALRCTYELLEQLPADERIAFALRVVDGMELTDVARACAVSLATIKRRLSRAERRFTALASAHPVLSEWVAEGGRWGGRT
jgi:RNA polymerase sigma-70 factor (ECF subfamily)